MDMGAMRLRARRVAMLAPHVPQWRSRIGYSSNTHYSVMGLVGLVPVMRQLQMATTALPCSDKQSSAWIALLASLLMPQMNERVKRAADAKEREMSAKEREVL